MVNCLKPAILIFMTPFPRLACFLITACLGGFTAGLEAQTVSTADLSKALARQDWDQALITSSNLSGPDIEAAASSAAKAGSVPAMWLMGQARYLESDPQGSADWLYVALLATRMDLGLCRQRQTQGIVYFWTQGLHEAVLATQINVTTRAPAIMKAIQQAQTMHPSDHQAGWTCRWAAKRNLIRDTDMRSMMLDKTDWAGARQRQLLEFCKETGLSLSALTPAVDDRQTVLPRAPVRQR